MTRKQFRLVFIAVALGVGGLAVGLGLYGARDSIALFKSPSDVAEQHIEPGTRLRIGGLVGDGLGRRRRRR